MGESLGCRVDKDEGGPCTLRHLAGYAAEAVNLGRVDFRPSGGKKLGSKSKSPRWRQSWRRGGRLVRVIVRFHYLMSFREEYWKKERGGSVGPCNQKGKVEEFIKFRGVQLTTTRDSVLFGERAVAPDRTAEGNPAREVAGCEP